ncbi:MAG: LacI family transcriptional regulator [Chloroflexota bacterium]|nr:MAG: LacI family transcriptional regulator [Chloroflexota bacterium]
MRRLETNHTSKLVIVYRDRARVGQEATVEPRTATIRDVAARAGVSTATVSRALRQSDSVLPATRQRVEEAARALRYRPSGVARSLKLRRTSTIGLIVTDIENPYFPQIISAVEDAAREHGHSVLLADGRRDPEREIESLDLLGDREVDGLIIASSELTVRHQDRIREVPCPVVIINSESTVAAVPAVLSDNVAGGRVAAEHVLSLGHRHIAYLAGPREGDRVAGDRLSGARERLQEASVPADALHVVRADEGVEGGERAARQVIESQPETTALLCYNDLTAVGAIRGLRSVGLTVPGDVSVMGFDDIEIAPYVDPALTTIRQATDEMARWAVASLFARIRSGREASAGAIDGEPGETRRLPVVLVARESTAQVRCDTGPSR